MHAKMILVDNQKLYIGSMNLSTNAIENNREIGIVVSDPYVLKRFTKQFAGDRETAHSF
ncbi:MAG: phospholipase D-like domain-containing protein [bacterium]|nr:phospholipase D-like domain-containing protein [bacterium]